MTHAHMYQTEHDPKGVTVDSERSIYFPAPDTTYEEFRTQMREILLLDAPVEGTLQFTQHLLILTETNRHNHMITNIVTWCEKEGC